MLYQSLFIYSLDTVWNKDESSMIDSSILRSFIYFIQMENFSIIGIDGHWDIFYHLGTDIKT